MKTFNDFKTFIEENKIAKNVPVKIAFRETALSDIEYLSLIVEGNGLTAADKSKNIKNKDIQLNLNTVNDILNAMEKYQENKEKRIASPIYERFEKNFTCSLLRKGVTTVKLSGFPVVNILFQKNEVVLDINFYV